MHSLDEKYLNRILGKHLNKNRIAEKGKQCTDEEYYNKWIRMYPDTHRNIIEAMKEAIQESEYRYVKK